MLEYIAKIATTSKKDTIIFMMLFVAIKAILLVNAFNRRYLADDLSRLIDATSCNMVVTSYM
jgi:hypothetical protein